MIKQVLLIWCSIIFLQAGAQTLQQTDSVKPPVSKSELKQLMSMSDSLMHELKKLYKLELMANEPNKYQPERISLIRTYLLLFEYVQRRCEVAQFKKADVLHIFGKPDTILYAAEKKNFQFYYNKVIKRYVRIINLRYRFYFKNNVLVAVRREDAY